MHHALEPKLIAKSDLVVCNSAQLAAFAHQFNANTHDIGQGLDLSSVRCQPDV